MKDGHPRFYQLLEEIADLHARKNSDYATEEEPLSNLRRCEKIGIPAWKGVIVRLEDKWDRIERLLNKERPSVEDESLIDTLKDNAVYSLLCIVLLEEGTLNPDSLSSSGTAYPCFCARCHLSWIAKTVKTSCSKCGKDDMVCTIETKRTLINNQEKEKNES